MHLARNRKTKVLMWPKWPFFVFKIFSQTQLIFSKVWLEYFQSHIVFSVSINNEGPVFVIIAWKLSLVYSWWKLFFLRLCVKLRGIIFSVCIYYCVFSIHSKYHLIGSILKGSSLLGILVSAYCFGVDAYCFSSINGMVVCVFNVENLQIYAKIFIFMVSNQTPLSAEMFRRARTRRQFSRFWTELRAIRTRLFAIAC